MTGLFLYPLQIRYLSVFADLLKFPKRDFALFIVFLQAKKGDFLIVKPH